MCCFSKNITLAYLHFHSSKFLKARLGVASSPGLLEPLLLLAFRLNILESAAIIYLIEFLLDCIQLVRLYADMKVGFDAFYNP